MADDKKITELPIASSLAGVELFEVVQGGVNKQANIDLILGDLGEADYVQEVVDSTGDTITLDLESKSFGNFSASTSTSAPREVVLDNEERAAFYYFNFEITDIASTYNFGLNTRSSDIRMYDEDGVYTGVFTALDVGLYSVHAIRRFGTSDWLLNFKGVYSVGDAPPTPTDQWVLSTGIWNNAEFWDNDAIWRDSP
jgi:hypothetical protein